MRMSTTACGRHFRLIVVGGGAAGCGASHKFARRLPNKSVAIIEPNEDHYYQPGFTLVGGGLMTLKSNMRKQSTLIHPNSVWIKDCVERFNPKQNSVILRDGNEISYDYMVVAVGLELRFDMIKGLPNALETPGVCSNYSHLYCEKTFQELQNFKEGNCVFTFPNTPIKCAGAPQKICYLADQILQERGIRDKANLIYATSLGKLFGIDCYLEALKKVAQEKNIDVRTRHNLVEVDTQKRIATFELLDEKANSNGRTTQIEYSVLHIAPPCTPVYALRHCPELTDAKGWVDVDPNTLQSIRFPNVFGVGDCINTPNAKTAAAVSSHLKTLEKNLQPVMNGLWPQAKYDGYASCPLVVGKSKVILAEFNSEGPMETIPLDQSKPRYIFYLLKRYFMPFLYWHGLVKGYWNGPATIRKILHFGLKK